MLASLGNCFVEQGLGDVMIHNEGLFNTPWCMHRDIWAWNNTNAILGMPKIYAIVFNDYNMQWEYIYI